MSLFTNPNYNFSNDAQTILQFLNANSLQLYSIADMVQSNAPNNQFFKIYINYPSNGVVAHRPICPDKPNILSGVGDASENGFWIGMFSREEVLMHFNTIQHFVNAVGAIFQLVRNSTCQRCDV